VISFLVLTFISSLVFFIMVFFLYIKRKQDISFLNDIITSIEEAKQGQFVHTNFKRRNDEYGLIATELNDMASKINCFIEKEYILKINQQDAEMKALQNQINPHFLYNTLEIIRSKALLNDDIDVSDAISNLGNLYRNIVKTENEITIEKELSLLNEYLKLMEFKYSSNF
jgi:two-component system sensor histidine kinase YesM